jgi:dipeptide/tripeptide permease
MPGGLKSDIKLGFGIGIGLMALGFVLMILQYILSRVKG